MGLSITSYDYPFRRGDKRWFDGRKAYLGARANADRPRLCHALEHAARNFGRFNDDDRQRDPWLTFPWLTPVLGSGAVAVADEPALTSEALSQKVATLVATRVDAGKGGGPTMPIQGGQGEDSFAWKAEVFTRALARDRLQEDRRARPSETDEGTELEWTIEPIAADLALLTALLTSWFNGVRSVTHAPLSRWDDDEAVLDPKSPLMSLQPFRDALLEPIAIMLNHVIDTLDEPTPDDDPVNGAVRNLVTEISKALQPGIGRARRLRMEHLRVLTEVTWRFLLLNTSVYPGWTDLLLGLMLEQGSGATHAVRRARPLYTDLSELESSVAALMRPAMERSWALSAPDIAEGTELGSRDNMYRTIGDVLWAQAELLATNTVEAPPAVAFVTSFDLEVEMGLWTSALARSGTADAQPFSVVIPVHLIDRTNSSAAAAEPRWLIGQVTPDGGLPWPEQLTRLQQPTGWRVLDSGTPARKIRNQPLVVHLGGCPLIALPDMTEVNGLSAADSVSLRHAVTVDEYLALRQAEAELFYSNQGNAGRGLPRELTEDSTRNPRFWMALGVPIGDPAVRHRLVSQITLRRMREAGGGHEAEPVDPLDGGGSLLGDAPPAPTGRDRRDVDGVVINRRVSDDEASLLYWLGLDVVRDDCLSFVGDLAHYVDHLRSPDDVRRTPIGGACRVSSSSRER